MEERKPILEFVGPRMSGFNGSLNLGPLKRSGGKERHELRAGTSWRDGDIREILYHNTLLWYTIYIMMYVCVSSHMYLLSTYIRIFFIAI